MVENAHAARDCRLDERRRRAGTVPVLFTGVVVLTGLCLNVLTPSVQANARVPAGSQGSNVSGTDGNKSSATRHSVRTASGRISYVEQGSGPVALFVHGVLLNGHVWRHQIADLSDIRRTIAVDLLAHGDTEIAPDQDVSVTANAKMLEEFLDALKIDQVDLVGNDSGGGIAQIFAALYPERIRTLTLTDCDTHDNWPPEAFKPFLAMEVAGGLRDTLEAMLADKSIYRSALGPAYEHPERLSDESIDTYLRPLVRTEQRTRDLQRFLAAFDNQHTLAVEARLKILKAPTLIVWGTDDVYFDVKWSRWLADAIPGARPPVEFKGARIFFPEERWADFNKELHYGQHRVRTGRLARTHHYAFSGRRATDDGGGPLRRNGRVATAEAAPRADARARTRTRPRARNRSLCTAQSATHGCRSDAVGVSA